MENAVSINHTKDNTIEFELSAEGLASKKMDVKFMIEADGVEIGFVAKSKKKNVWEVKLPPLSILSKSVYPFHISVHADGYHFEPMKGIVNVTGETKLFADKIENTTFAPAKKKAEPKKEEPEKEIKKTEAKEEKKDESKEKPRKAGDVVKKIAREFSIKDKKGDKASASTKKAASKTPAKKTPAKKKEVKETVQTTPTAITDEVQQLAEALLTEKSNKPAAPEKSPEEIAQEDKAQKVMAVLEEVGITPKSRTKRPRISFIKSEIFPDED